MVAGHGLSVKVLSGRKSRPCNGTTMADWSPTQAGVVMANIDMVAFMDNLLKSGFTDQQAKALSQALLQLIDTHLVTRDYLDLRLAQLKMEIIQWLVGLMLVQSGVTAVLFKLLH
jgi:hypothetical protein